MLAAANELLAIHFAISPPPHKHLDTLAKRGSGVVVLASGVVVVRGGGGVCYWGGVV